MLEIAKGIFGLSDKSNFLLQQYNQEWDTWLDVEEVQSVRDKQKLCLVLSQGMKQVSTYV